MRRDDAGYVTVEHAVCFAAVTLVIGVIAATAQAGLTGSPPCQAVREGAPAAPLSFPPPFHGAWVQRPPATTQG